MLDAARAMNLSSKDLLNLKVIDEIIQEPLGGAHRDKDLILKNVKESIINNLNFFKGMSQDEILSHRKEKFLKIGRDKGFVNNSGELSSLDSNKNNLEKIFLDNKKIIYSVGAIVAIILISIAFL